MGLCHHLVRIATPAMAQSFPCSNASASPYPTLVTTDHDHQRIAPVGSSLTKAFTAYYSSFDEGGEKDGEATHVLRLNPQFVSYELRGVGPDANGDYAEPPVSIGRPNHWYTSPELIPLVDSIQGVTNRRIDDSYRRCYPRCTAPFHSRRVRELFHCNRV